MSHKSQKCYGKKKVVHATNTRKVSEWEKGYCRVPQRPQSELEKKILADCGFADINEVKSAIRERG
jgi:hypothetical protein